MKLFTVTVSYYGKSYSIDFNYTPGDPGRLSGPPEDCYPPEPEEVEVTAIKFKDKEVNSKYWERMLDLFAIDDEFLCKYANGEIEDVRIEHLIDQYGDRKNGYS